MITIDGLHHVALTVTDLARGPDVVGDNDNILSAGEVWSYTASAGAIREKSTLTSRETVRPKSVVCSFTDARADFSDLCGSS